MTHTTMLATCAAITVAGALLAVALPTPSDPIVLNKFDDTWKETMVPLGFKQAQLNKPAQPPEPTPVRVIPIIPTTNSKAPEVPVTPEVTEEPTPAVRVAKRYGSRTEARDICRGKGKRYTHNGRSWRCRR